MKHLAFLRVAAVGIMVLAGSLGAQAQTPQDIQAQIAGGQENQALGELKTIVAAHPDSGVAWYLVAEAQDAAGREDAARNALAKADQLAPGLPFAKPADVAALQAHLAGPGQQPAAPARRGISPLIVGIVVVVGVFLLLRMFRRRRQYMAPPGYNAGYPGGPAGPNYGPGAPYGGGGSGIGGSILGGLAAGAAFAGGERIIDDMMGGNRPADPGNDPGPVPDRDDGLNGNPGWNDDDNQNGGGFDPGNSW